MSKKQSSDEMSSLASGILSGRIKPTKKQIHSLAGCVLGQDETRGPNNKRETKKPRKPKKPG